MKWHTQAGKVATNSKVKIYFTLPELSAKKIVMWNCHADDSDKKTFYMISGRYILTDLVLNIKFYDPIIEADDRTFKVSTAPMVDRTYEFKYLETDKLHLKNCL